MEWDWKDFAWDPPGLEEKTNEEDEDSSVDLRLNSSDMVAKESKNCVSSSSKRSRLPNGSQNMSCLVDGCTSDLSGCREYHRRHRVCEKHSKTPVVLVRGKQQRFCQQCSRFHSLGEFDEVKRSCRKRLDGHNKRRRKPQPPSFLMTAEKFMYNYKGPRILQFGNRQAYANPVVRNMWPTASKSGAESGYDHHQFLYRIEKPNRDNKELLLWQDNAPKSGNANEAMPAGTPAMIRQPICGTTASSASRKGSRKQQPPSFDSKPGAFDSGCALYLLSTLQTQSSDLSFMQSGITCPMQSPSGAAQFAGVDDKPGGSVFVLDANATNLHCNGVLQMGPDRVVENGDSLRLPFFWE